MPSRCSSRWVETYVLIPRGRKQLPRAELPRVAAALRQVSFEPGERIIEAGREGKGFFIIKAGEASARAPCTASSFKPLRSFERMIRARSGELGERLRDRQL